MKLFTLVLAVLIPVLLFAQDKPSLRSNDRIRINEAFKIQKQFGDKIWKDWHKVSFAIGAREGLLLDYINPDWKSHYFNEKFFLKY